MSLKARVIIDMFLVMLNLAVYLWCGHTWLSIALVGFFLNEAIHERA